MHLVAPDGGKDVVQLDVDGREGQKAAHGHLGCYSAVPGPVRDLARELGCSAGRLKFHLSQHLAHEQELAVMHSSETMTAAERMYADSL